MLNFHLYREYTSLGWFSKKIPKGEEDPLENKYYENHSDSIYLNESIFVWLSIVFFVLYLIVLIYWFCPGNIWKIIGLVTWKSRWITFFLFNWSLFDINVAILFIVRSFIHSNPLPLLNIFQTVGHHRIINT